MEDLCPTKEQLQQAEKMRSKLKEQIKDMTDEEKYEYLKQRLIRLLYASSENNTNEQDIANMKKQTE